MVRGMRKFTVFRILTPLHVHIASDPDTLQGVTWRRDHHGSVHLPVRRSNNDCSPSELESEVRAGLMTGVADQYLVSEAERSDKVGNVQWNPVCGGHQWDLSLCPVIDGCPDLRRCLCNGLF